MLKPQPKAIKAEKTAQTRPERGEARFLLRHKSGVNASASEEDGEFIVLEGSEALRNSGYAHNSSAALKQRLLDAGALNVLDDGRYTFFKPTSFTSPSAAASVILDRNANGRTEWKHAITNQTYHDWQQSQAAAQEVTE